MKLIFLGSAAAFTLDANNFQSNMLLVADNGRKLLIDCGTDIRWALNMINVHHADIDAVYVSHLHADHIGGLEWLGFSTKFFQNGQGQKPTFFAHEDITTSIWDESLRGGLSSLQNEVATLDSFFKTHPIGKENTFTWEGVEFTLVKTKHVKMNDRYMPSYGLYFEINGCKIFLTTDAILWPEVFNFYYHKADIIFHDCETLPGRTNAHANYMDLINLPPEVKSKIWLYDYNDGQLPDCKKDGFLGYIVRGQEFKF